MIFLSILILIVAIALPSINQNIRSILYVRISSIIFIYAGALSLNALYIQSIGSGIGIYSGLFQVTVISQLLDVSINIYNCFTYLINNHAYDDSFLFLFINPIKPGVDLKGNNKRCTITSIIGRVSSLISFIKQYILNFILVILFIVLFFFSFYDLSYYQLPGTILSYIFSFLIFHFIYYRFKFSNNIYIGLLQKFIAFNFCFIAAIFIASIFDLYIYQVVFNDGNIHTVKESITLWISSPSENYEFKIPKKPIDIVVQAAADAASNIVSSLGAAGAGGAVGAACVKHLPLPPVQRAASGIIVAGCTSAAVTAGIQGGSAIGKALNNSPAIKNHPYGDPDVTRVPSPEPGMINSPLENGNESNPLVDLLLSLVSLNLLELLVLLLLVLFLINRIYGERIILFLGAHLPNRFLFLSRFFQVAGKFNATYYNFLIVFLFLLLLVMLLVSFFFNSVLYTQIDDFVQVYNKFKGRSN